MEIFEPLPMREVALFYFREKGVELNGYCERYKNTGVIRA